MSCVDWWVADTRETAPTESFCIIDAVNNKQYSLSCYFWMHKWYEGLYIKLRQKLFCNFQFIVYFKLNKLEQIQDIVEAL